MNLAHERRLLVITSLSAALFATACDGSPTGAPPPAPAAPSKVVVAAEPGRELYKVPLADSPAQGPAEARVTLVVFSEFQCPFCSRVVPTVDKLVERYGDDLRVVFKHLPLPFHDRALPAALAAEAAREQGQFWAMHDRLFAEQTALAPADLERHASSLGLDVARWKAHLADPALKARVDADLKLAEGLGVRGTPTFFINGRKLVGAQPLDAFVRAIDEERKRADEKLKTGVSRAGLYAALIDGGLEKAPAGTGEAKPGGACPQGNKNCPGAGNGGAAAARPADDPARNTTVVDVPLGNAPVRGPKDAPITVVLFSDFECPYCKRIETTVAALEAAFPGKIRVAWKNFPLDFHAGARPAARLALQAHQTGKFWAMHDKLLENQRALDGPSLEGYGRALGVATRADAALDAQIDADVKQGAALGVTGTPTVFINGRRIAGAYPLETFRTIVEQELAKAGAGR